MRLLTTGSINFVLRRYLLTGSMPRSLLCSKHLRRLRHMLPQELRPKKLRWALGAVLLKAYLGAVFSQHLYCAVGSKALPLQGAITLHRAMSAWYQATSGAVPLYLSSRR